MSILARTASSSGPASARMSGDDVKYANAAGYSEGSRGPYL
jgi:hypothetical protein